MLAISFYIGTSIKFIIFVYNADTIKEPLAINDTTYIETDDMNATKLWYLLAQGVIKRVTNEFNKL